MTANTTTFHFIGDAILQGTRDDQGDSSVSDVDAVSLLLSHSVRNYCITSKKFSAKKLISNFLAICFGGLVANCSQKPKPPNNWR